MKLIKYILSALLAAMVFILPVPAQSNLFGYTTPPDSTSTSSDPVGTPEGSFAVSPLGAATYTIPIECPQGLPGMTPRLAITYNSQAGNGVAGFGCSLSGLSVITRVPRDIYHDGQAHGMDYTAGDGFSLDGQRLILTQAAAGGDSAVYCLENDPRTRVVLHGLSNQSNGLQWFSVEGTDGIYREYGKYASSRVQYSDFGVNKIMAWSVNLAISAEGNRIDYNYTRNGQALYPSYIDYGMPTRFRVKFEYENRPDTIHFTLVGHLGQIAKRLKTIRALQYESGSWLTFREYTLSYNQTADCTGLKYSRLTSVEKSNGSGEALRPVSIEWNYLPCHSPTTSSHTLPSFGNATNAERKDVAYFAMDANADGLSDVIKLSRVRGQSSNSMQSWTTYLTAYTTSLNSSGGFQFTRNELGSIGELTSTADGWNSIRSYPSSMDADGDGHGELLIPQYSQSFDEYRGVFFQIYRPATGDVLAVLSYELQLDDFDDKYLYTVADLDNDGKDEIVVIEEHSDGTAYPGAILWSHSAGSPQSRPLRFALQGKPKQIIPGDFNSDGMTDLMVFYNSGYGVCLNDGTWVHETTLPLSMAADTYPSGYSVGNSFLGDFNGDGIPDILFCNSLGDNWYVSMGKGKPDYSLVLAEHFCLDGACYDMDDHFSCLVYDTDGDGRSDAVITKKVSGTSHTYWLKSNGKTLVLDKHTTSNSADDSFSCQKVVGDFNGDGLPELAGYGRNCYVDTTNGSPSFYICRNGTFSPGSGKVNRFTDGLGNQTDVIYKPLTDTGIYTVGTGASYPVADATPPLHVVSQTIQTDGASSDKTTNYHYGGLRAHVSGRGLMGFTSASASCPTTGVSTATTVEWDNSTYTPSRTTRTTTVGDETTEDMSHMQTVQYGNLKAYYHLPDRDEHKDPYGYRTITTRTFHSGFHHALRNETIGYPEGHTVNTEYNDYVIRHSMCLPQTVSVSKSYNQDGLGMPNLNLDWFYDTSTLQYDTYGRVTSKTEHSESSLPVTTSYTYDSYGNVLSETTSAVGVENVTRQYQYDSTHRFLTKITERGYIETEYTRDLWGNMLTETDKTRAAYPRTTTYTYDNWGNLTSVTSPEGLLTTYKRGWGPTQAKKYYTLEQGTARPWVKTWYDSNGREVETESIGQDDISMIKATSYNSKGQVASITDRLGTQSVTETITYYANGRKNTDALSTGKSTAYTYGWQSVTATSSGRATTTRYDSWGNVVETEDALGNKTTYNYSSCGKPISVTSCGTTVTMEYDDIGNQTSLTDPDAGTMTYTYDAYGRIMTQSDGRGITTTNCYDAKGRLSSTATGGVTTTYTYGQMSSDNGLLLSTSRNGKTIDYTYDQYGRISQESRHYSGYGARSFQYAYGSNGLLASAQYPGQVSVGYLYDCYGNREEVLVNGETAWQLDGIAVQSSSVTTTSLLGSGMTAATETDKAGRVTSKAVRDINNNPLCYQSYHYDSATDDMTYRFGMFSNVEHFTYDGLDRLTEINDYSTPRTISYSCSGNITSQTGIGRYFYDDPRPHAVSAVENTGRVIPLNRIDTQYNAFGKIAQIVDGGPGMHRMAFDYGPDNERWRTQLFRDSTTLRRTAYYWGDYEEVVEGGVTRSLYYLDGNVLYKKQTDCPDSLFYIFTDHLGSIVAILDESGGEKFRAAYDAWGNQTVTRNDIGFHRGYTGHEMLPEFGLINMNGRLYDPQIGRFLSTDNYVQEPWNSQNFNRYSYCLNNPLKYNDQSGEFFHLIIGAVLGGMINWMMHDCQWNAKGLGCFGVGAAAGFLSAGVSAGICSSLPVAGSTAGGFSAGFWGTSSATIATSSFVSGAAIGGAAGVSGGFVTGFGNSLIDGNSFSKSLGQGCLDGLIGGVGSGLIGGITGGLHAVSKGRTFFNGWGRQIDVIDKGHPIVGQNAAENCVGASCESLTDGAVTQDQIRSDYNKHVGKITDPNKEGMPDLGRYKYAAKNVGRQAEYVESVNRNPQYIFDQMTLGDDFGITYGVSGVDEFGNAVTGNHNVLMQKASQTTWIKHNGTMVIRKPKLWVMDPAHGGSIRRIYKSQLVYVIRVF